MFFQGSQNVENCNIWQDFWGNSKAEEKGQQVGGRNNIQEAGDKKWEQKRKKAVHPTSTASHTQQKAQKVQGVQSVPQGGHVSSPSSSSSSSNLMTPSRLLLNLSRGDRGEGKAWSALECLGITPPPPRGSVPVCPWAGISPKIGVAGLPVGSVLADFLLHMGGIRLQ